MTEIGKQYREYFIISIHIPRVGDDQCWRLSNTPSKRVSIHIPRVGDDGDFVPGKDLYRSFNPHPPCGG